MRTFRRAGPMLCSIAAWARSHEGVSVQRASPNPGQYIRFVARGGVGQVRVTEDWEISVADLRESCVDASILIPTTERLTLSKGRTGLDSMLSMGRVPDRLEAHMSKCGECAAAAVHDE
jgi:hypothetical protein